MAKLKIIKITTDNYKKLLAAGSSGITINGVKYVYDEDAVYITTDLSSIVTGMQETDSETTEELETYGGKLEEIKDWLVKEFPEYPSKGLEERLETLGFIDQTAIKNLDITAFKDAENKWTTLSTATQNIQNIQTEVAKKATLAEVKALDISQLADSGEKLSKIGALETSVTALGTSVSNLSSDISTNYVAKTSIASTLDTLGFKKVSLTNGVLSVTDANNATTTITPLTSHQSLADYATIATVNSSISTLNSSIETVNAKIPLISRTNNGDIQYQYIENNETKTTLLASTTQVANEIATSAANTLASAKSYADGVGTTAISSAKSEIKSEVKDEISELYEPKFSANHKLSSSLITGLSDVAVSGDYTSLTNTPDIAGINSNISTLSTSLSTVTAKANTLETNLGTLSTNQTSLANRVTTVETNKTDSTEVNSLIAGHSAVTSKVTLNEAIAGVKADNDIKDIQVAAITADMSAGCRPEFQHVLCAVSNKANSSDTTSRFGIQSINISNTATLVCFDSISTTSPAFKIYRKVIVNNKTYFEYLNDKLGSYSGSQCSIVTSSTSPTSNSLSSITETTTYNAGTTYYYYYKVVGSTTTYYPIYCYRAISPGFGLLARMANLENILLEYQVVKQASFIAQALGCGVELNEIPVIENSVATLDTNTSAYTINTTTTETNWTPDYSQAQIYSVQALDKNRLVMTPSGKMYSAEAINLYMATGELK